MLNPIGTYQGPALGPLLFNIYATDMSLFLTDDASHDRCLVQYADDTQLAVLGSPRNVTTVVDRLQREPELAAPSLFGSVKMD